MSSSHAVYQAESLPFSVNPGSSALRDQPGSHCLTTNSQKIGGVMIVSHVVGLLLTVPGVSDKNLSLMHDALSPLCRKGCSEAPKGTRSVEDIS